MIDRIIMPWRLLVCCLMFVVFISSPVDAQFPTIALIPHISGLTLPVHVTHAGDGTGRQFIVEQPGRIRIARNGILQTAPFLDITGRVLSGGERGLLSVAFPPGFALKGYFYVYYTDLVGNLQISRFFVTADPDVADPNTEVMLLNIAHPTFANHNGGQLAFGPDGFLYAATGDGGGGGDPGDNAQNPLSLLGKMLRLDVESAVVPPLTYNIPASNPFVGNPGFRAEIWSLGLRNPFRFSFDRQTGDLYIGDVGQNSFEEVDFQPAASAGGQNYGWNIMEGLHCFSIPTCNPAGLTLPVAEYDHLQGDCSVTGGMVYRGALHPAMQGVYFYGDFCTGRIRGLEGVNTVLQNALLLDTSLSISSFGEDEAGEIYVADLALGNISRITAVTFLDVPPTGFGFNQIEAIANAGITAGCGGGNFCPDSPITRKEMAVFLETSLGVTPAPPCAGNVFTDVTAVSVGAAFCGFVEDLAARGITGGCGGGNFCPNDLVTRAQMAVFIEAALGRPASACTGGVFSDVNAATVGATFCGFIERLAADGITGGCGGGNFCPNTPVSRAQMAVFLVAAPPPLLP